MPFLDEIRAGTPALQHLDLAVPEWGGRVVRIPELDALDRVELLERVFGDGGKDAKHGRREHMLATARLVAMVARDPESGALRFGDEIDQGADLLARRFPKVAERIAEAFFELNGVKPQRERTAEGKDAAAASDAPRTA